MPYGSILREFVAQMMINDQGLGVRRVHNGWCSAASLIHDNDEFGIFCQHGRSLRFIMYSSAFAD